MGTRILNKRGSILDALFIIIFIFVGAIFALVGHTMYSNFNDSVIDNPELFDENVTAVSAGINTDYVRFTDNFFGFAIIILGLGTFAAAMYIPTNATYFIIGIIFLIIFVGVAAIMSNAYEEVATDADLSTYADDYVILPFILAQYPKILVVLTALLLLGLYAKGRGSEG